MPASEKVLLITSDTFISSSLSTRVEVVESSFVPPQALLEFLSIAYAQRASSFAAGQKRGEAAGVEEATRDLNGATGETTDRVSRAFLDFERKLRVFHHLRAGCRSLA